MRPFYFEIDSSSLYTCLPKVFAQKIPQPKIPVMFFEKCNMLNDLDTNMHLHKVDVYLTGVDARDGDNIFVLFKFSENVLNGSTTREDKLFTAKIRAHKGLYIVFETEMTDLQANAVATFKPA